LQQRSIIHTRIQGARTFLFALTERIQRLSDFSGSSALFARVDVGS
jgi:hypothetical protein